MEKQAREIFRDALALHYIEGICQAGTEVDAWLKTHGGWLPNPQEVYGDGTPLTQPEDEGWDVMSKEPEKAMKDATDVMILLAEFLRDGIAEEMDQCDLKASADAWLEAHRWYDLPPLEQVIDLEADEPPQSVKEKSGRRDRSRSPRRNVAQDMMIATMKETILALEQTIRAKDEIIRKMKMDKTGVGQIR